MKTLVIVTAKRVPARAERRRLEAADQYPHELLFDEQLQATMLNAEYIDGLPASRRALYRLLPLGLGQVIEAYRLRQRYDAVITWSPRLTLLYALVLKLGRPGRSSHIAIMYALTPRNKALLLKRVHHQIDRIITWTSIQRNGAVQSLGVPASKIEVIPHFVDERFWRPMDVAPDTISAVGNEMRDYPTLIEAMRGQDLHCHIATTFPLSRGRRIALPPNVSVGRKAFVELRALYARSYFVVVPLHPTETDSGATAILEAMAMGKAVICSRVRGQVGLVQEGKTGLLVTPGDPHELRRAIQNLRDHPDVARSMGRAGRQLVEQRHRLGTFVNRVQLIVQEDAFSLPSAACEGG